LINEGRALDARLDRASNLDDRLSPPDREVWAVLVLSGQPGSCPSPGAPVPFDQEPCPFATMVVIYLDARTGEYLGSDYRADL
jgi:hypothetical protein